MIMGLFRYSLIVVFLIFLPGILLAEGLTFNGYAETGSRATDEADYQPELVDSYTYHFYHLKMEQSAKDLAGYNIGIVFSEKEYETLSTLNNDSTEAKAGVFIG